MIENLKKEPDIKISIKQTFGIDTDLEVDAFSEKNELVPEIDKDYVFDRDTTLAILNGRLKLLKLYLYQIHSLYLFQEPIRSFLKMHQLRDRYQFRMFV